MCRYSLPSLLIIGSSKLRSLRVSFEPRQLECNGQCHCSLCCKWMDFESISFQTFMWSTVDCQVKCTHGILLILLVETSLTSLYQSLIAFTQSGFFTGHQDDPLDSIKIFWPTGKRAETIDIRLGLEKSKKSTLCLAFSNETGTLIFQITTCSLNLQLIHGTVPWAICPKSKKFM